MCSWSKACKCYIWILTAITSESSTQKQLSSCFLNRGICICVWASFWKVQQSWPRHDSLAFFTVRLFLHLISHSFYAALLNQASFDLSGVRTAPRGQPFLSCTGNSGLWIKVLCGIDLGVFSGFTMVYLMTEDGYMHIRSASLLYKLNKPCQTTERRLVPLWPHPCALPFLCCLEKGSSKCQRDCTCFDLVLSCFLC